MAKKNKNFSKEGKLNQPLTSGALEEAKIDQGTKQPVEKAKNKRVKSDKPNVFKRIGRVFKEMISELKKVSWTSLPKALAQTGIVLGVVLIFILILGGIDTLLSFLLGFFVKGGK